MASRGASVNPLTAVLDRSEIAERPPRGRRIRSQRARDTGRERQRAPTEWRSKNISQITQVAVKARQRPFQEGLHHETRNLTFGRRGRRARLWRRRGVRPDAEGGRPDAEGGERSRLAHLRR